MTDALNPHTPDETIQPIGVTPSVEEATLPEAQPVGAQNSNAEPVVAPTETLTTDDAEAAEAAAPPEPTTSEKLAALHAELPPEVSGNIALRKPSADVPQPVAAPVSAVPTAPPEPSVPVIFSPPVYKDKLGKVAVLGATGLVGRHLIELLEQRHFPMETLVPLASARTAGGTIQFRGQAVTVQLATPDAFEGVDLVLASAGGSVSAQLVPEAIKRGAVVVDNSSHYRMEEGVPLVVAGVNNADLAQHHGVVANPNCSTAQLMPVLNALKQVGGLKRVMVSTYQSVSGAGKEGLDGLKASTQALLAEDGTMAVVPPFQRAIGGNLIPQIDVFCDEDEVKDYTKEEAKLIRETRKILGLPHLKISATAVRVPVMVGHSESVTVDLEKPLTPVKVAKLLRTVPNVVVAENREDYHTPREIAGTDPVYVSRIRRDTSNPTHGIHLWVVADNLRIGAALNAVRLAERLVTDGLVRVPAESLFLKGTQSVPSANAAATPEVATV